MPMALDHVFPQDFRNDMNDIMGLLDTLPVSDVPVDDRSSALFLSETINASSGKITILALGGFTNIAQMLESYPETDISKIEAIYTMAGAVYVDGNIQLLNNAQPDWDQGAIYSTNISAEWNVFVDPVAAKIVFDSTIPIVLVPLDACNNVILEPSYTQNITATDPIANLVR